QTLNYGKKPDRNDDSRAKLNPQQHAQKKTAEISKRKTRFWLTTSACTCSKFSEQTVRTGYKPLVCRG
ncbi:MAG TPA: hypothetical protein VF893_06250, partial [Candidatus Bathyarchaeia archaeon]